MELIDTRTAAVELHDNNEAPTLPKRKRPPIRLILAIAADHYGVSRAQIVGLGRFKVFVRPRQVIMFIATAHYGYSQPQVGSVLNRDHTSVLHGRRRIGAACDDDPDLRRDVDNILARIREWQEDPANLILQPQPQPETKAEQEPDPLLYGGAWTGEALRLRGRGWSVSGLARRYDRPEPEVAALVGATWWAGDRCEPLAIAA